MSRIEALQHGAGSLSSVQAAMEAQARIDGDQIDYAVKVAGFLSNVDPSSAEGDWIKTLFASWLNQEIASYGRLWTCTQHGFLTYEYFSGDSAKKMIASLISD